MKKIHQWEHKRDTYRLVNTEYGHVLEVLKKDALGENAWLRKATLADPCERLLCAAIEQLVGERILAGGAAKTWYVWAYKYAGSCDGYSVGTLEEALTKALGGNFDGVFVVDGLVHEGRAMPGAKLGRCVWRKGQWFTWSEGNEVGGHCGKHYCVRNLSELPKERKWYVVEGEVENRFAVKGAKLGERIR